MYKAILSNFDPNDIVVAVDKENLDGVVCPIEVADISDGVSLALSPQAAKELAVLLIQAAYTIEKYEEKEREDNSETDIFL